MSLPALRFKDDKGQDFPEWEETTLGAIGKFKSGTGFPDKEQGGAAGIPFYKVSDMNLQENMLEMLVANNYVNDTQVKHMKLKVITEEAIIFAKVGAAIFLERKRKAKNFLIDNNMMAFIPTTCQINFMKHFMDSIRLSKFAQVGALPSYNASDLSIIEVSVPSKKEQTKIANFLTAVDEKITQLTQKCELLAQYKKGVMQQIFSQELRFKDDDGQDFPDWETHPLNYWLSESKARNNKLHFNKTDVLSVSGEFGVVNQIEFMGRSYAGASVHNYHILDSGNIVYTKSPLKNNPYGIIKLNKGKCGIVSTLYAVYKCHSNINGEILDYYFQLDTNLNNYLKPLVRKGAKNDMKVNNGHVLTGQVCLPTCTIEQNRIVDFLNKLDEKIKSVQDQLAAAKQYKQGLLQQMFV